MRPSSSISELGLFGGVLGRGGVAAVTGDQAWLAALLRVESALATVQGRLGLIPPAAAEAIATACSTVDIDVTRLAADAAASGNPVVPLVSALKTAVPVVIAISIHKGATSQDILDSAAMLVARDALDVILVDAAAAADAAATLARTYRDTPMPGRTLLRQAVPITFGLKAAGWLTGLDAARARLAAVRATGLAVQYGGPAGTLAGLDGAGPAVVAGLAAELGLAEPVLAWHTDRTRIADLAGALGGLAGIGGKIGRDLTLLAQDEVDEVSEGTPGGSSAMAHKRNPVAGVSVVAAALRAPGLVATLLAAMMQEHERAAGAWHAEWLPLRDLLVTTGSAMAWLRTGLSELTVDSHQMLSHVDSLMRTLGTTQLDLGSSGELVDRALAAHDSTGVLE